MNLRYVLDEQGNPVPEPDLETWARWFEAAGTARQVARTEIDEAYVSTVFLGIDHNFMGGAPILFETMIFGGPWDQGQWRYMSRAQAIAAHDQIVACVRAGRNPGEVASYGN